MTANGRKADATLSGFMELLPAPQTQMERLMEVLRSSYGVYGFTPLDTPIIEASDVLLAKGGGETEKQIYRFSTLLLLYGMPLCSALR